MRRSTSGSCVRSPPDSTNARKSLRCTLFMVSLLRACKSNRLAKLRPPETPCDCVRPRGTPSNPRDTCPLWWTGPLAFGPAESEKGFRPRCGSGAGQSAMGQRGEVLERLRHPTDAVPRDLPTVLRTVVGVAVLIPALMVISAVVVVL